MTAWVLIMFVSMYGEYAIPGIASEAECRALYVKIESYKLRHNPGNKPDMRDVRCYSYEVAK